ncbi:MAG: sigma-54-dependent Fis family transcriptional regulator [Deltaproteobacteria bacterium]|nr:sigma-54-dependent Fis family transcriptional regulator [Deltaproteobacteria bacterium]
MSERARLLIVDDDRAVLDYLLETLGTRFEVAGEQSGVAALARLDHEEFDVVISDVEMPGMRGPELLAAILDKRPLQAVVIITAFGSIDLAVTTVRAGACDFVTKPFRIENLVVAIERALRERTMRRELVRLRRSNGDELDGGLVAKSAAMAQVLDLARRAARTDATVLIGGESGVGKGALARWIHERSARRDAALVELNCAALPSGLVEAELFGVRRGAFTDASENRAGLFAEAHRGTLFLDEIAEMPIEAQAKLLRVLESGSVRPVGGTAEVTVDVRLVAATNRDLGEAIDAGRFRRDLFFRLDVVRIDIPPLRARPEDIPELVHAFLARYPRGPLGITDEAMRWLCKRPWPGNVRELSNAVQRAVALSEHDSIVIEDVRDHRPVADTELADAAARRLSLAEVELAYIKQIVAAVGGNMAQAARVLGIDRRTLYRKLSHTS